MALSSWPALSSHSLVMVSPTFFMSALSRALAATMAMPFFFSRSRYPVFLAVLVAQPRVSASAGHLQQRSLAGRVQRVQRGLVDDHRVLGQPGLGVHPEFQVLVGLAVVAGGAAGHVAFDHAGGHGLAQLGRLHGERLRAHQFGDAAGAGAVSAPLHALQVGRAADRLLRTDALRRPGHRVQQLHALLGQFPLQQRLLHLEELAASSQLSARKGRPPAAWIGHSLLKSASRISPICAWPPCTARLISGALTSAGLACTVIFSLPAEALSTSLANCTRCSVWKLLAA